MLAGRSSLLAWKQAAAAQMCSYGLETFGSSGDVPSWLESLQDQDWVDAALSPFVSTLILDETAEWTQRYAIDQSIRFLRTPRDERYPWRDVPPELLPILRRMGVGSRRPSCEEADFILPDEPEWRSHARHLQEGMQLLASLASGLLEELFTVSSAVVLVNANASFRGASGTSQRGLIFLSPESDWDEIVFAEELVHESTHCILDLISLCSPLFTADSAYQEKHRAPFRPDLRAWYGNFHAVVVCARCIGFYRTLMDRRSDQVTRSMERIADLRNRAGPVSAELLPAPMSDVANSIFQAWVVPEFRDWLC